MDFIAQLPLDNIIVSYLLIIAAKAVHISLTPILQWVLQCVRPIKTLPWHKRVVVIVR